MGLVVAASALPTPRAPPGMLNSGYEGTREITKRLRNTMGWSATAGAVDNFVCPTPRKPAGQTSTIKVKVGVEMHNSVGKCVKSKL